MEPNRLENEFREKLGQRTIQPTEMAWDRLDAMLSVTEKKRKPKRTWIYIAASFLGFLLVGTIFLKQGSESHNTTTPESNTVATAPEKASVNNNEVNNSATTIVPQETVQVQEQQALAAISHEGTAKATVVKKSASARTEIVNAPVITKEAVAQVQDATVNKPLANESESLLAVAQADETVKKSAIKVNANSLLSSVEGELDKSFKDKALQSAVKNFNTVKSSLANRNHK